tara:strand:- start:15 stop:509 length:495 start_codon:yes stop_codon:yes gene_type:complete
MALTRGNPRQARAKIGGKEFQARKILYLKLTREGFTDAQLNSYWNEWQKRGNTKTDGFESFIRDQVRLERKKIEIEEKVLAEIKEEEEAQVIKDLNLFPEEREPITTSPTLSSSQKVITNTTTSSKNQLKDEQSTKKSPNYLLYALIVAVGVGGFLIYNRMKKK